MIKKRKIIFTFANIFAVLLSLTPEFSLFFYFKRSEDFTKWYMYKFIGILQVVLIVFFLAFWAIALSRVHSKLKLTGQTPPKKGIFIAHFVLVSLFILSTITSNLVFYYYNGKAWMYYTFWIT